ncbi:MAG: LysM peptidoglycan-binding domain-containing protein [Anaerolineae bacterium]|jgi:LysM repeat protein|nr:LysM peptidoglycan-binding domain-containing protein [Anaerolineae bacterium]
MFGKKLKTVATLLVLAVTMFALFPTSIAEAEEAQAPQRQTGGVNLLVNPGFEGIGKPVDNALPNYDNWTRSTFTGAVYGEIFTPEGWVTWWQEGEFKRPECKVIPNEAPFNGTPSRIYQGYYSGMCFTFFGKQNAGYYQVVRNIPAGSVVQGSFYAHSWSCTEDEPVASCGDPNQFYFRVGIDPNGGTDPFSGSIAWSGQVFHPDVYGYVGPVQATVGASGAATLFVQAYGKWPNKHNDAYFDSPSLSIVGVSETATPTPPPPPPTEEAPEVAPTSAATPTARPDGSTVHTVVAGDTLFGLALTYGVDVQQIYDLNDLTSASILSIGQEIVIATTGAVAATPTPTPAVVETPLPVAPTATPASPGTTTGALPVAPAQGKGAVCVSAFHDANADMFRQTDGSEMLLPNAQVSLLGRSGPVDNRTTDGISEPWCFNDLEPGSYIIRHTAPAGYVLTDAGQWNFTLDSGEVESVELAYTRDAGVVSEDPTANPDEVAPTEEPEESSGGVTNVLNVILRVSGFIVLALAIAVLVLFVLSRRSA